MKLTGAQLGELHTALQSAFRSRTDLERLLRFRLDVRLDQITGSSRLPDVVQDMIDWAEANGRLDELIQAAHAENPGNLDLAAFVKSLSGPPTPAAVPTAPATQAPAAAAQSPVTAATKGPVELFFSYAHADEKLRDELAKHLKLLHRQGVIQAWHDRQITPGGEWKGDIDAHLESARIILLLVSPDFMASDYCWDVETKRAMERHDAGEAVVIPIALRPVDWHGAPFGKLQGLPKDIKPVTSWPDRDEAFLNIAQGIRAVAQRLAA